MKLFAVDIANFRVIQSARIELEDAVIGIVGPNGAGKSTLVEAVAWALYGNPAARSGKNEIKTQTASPGKACSVELYFESKGEKYRLIRRLVGKSERAEVELYRGNNSESVGIRETQGYIAQLIGLDYEGFQTSFLARQQELNALSDLQPARRRSQLAGMLGIDRLDKVMARIKEDNRGYAGQAEYISRRLVPESRIKDEMKIHQERLAGLADQKDQFRQQMDKLDQLYKEAVEKLSQAQTLKDKHSRAQSELQAVRQTSEYLKEQKKNLADELKQLEGLKKKHRELEEQTKPLEILRGQLKDLEQARARQQLRVTLEKQLEKNGCDLERNTEENNQARQRHQATITELKGIPHNIESLSNEAAAAVNKAREQYGTRKAELERLVRDIDLLRKQLGNIEQFGPDSVCDRCLRPLGDDLPRMKAHLTEEIAQLEQDRKNASENLAKDKETGIKLAEQEKRSQVQFRRFRELTQASQADGKELEKLEQRRKEIEQQHQEAAARLAELPQQTFDEHEYTQLLEKEKKLSRTRSEYDRITGQLERLPELRESLDKLTEKTIRAENELQQAEQVVVKLGFSPEEFRRISENHNRLQNEFMDAREKAAKAEHEYHLAEKDLASLQEKLDTQAREREELEESRISLHHGEKLANLMAAYKQHLVASIRPALAELSSRLVSEMTNGRYSLLELDEDYNLRLMDSGEFFGIERFSGGEKDLANLCLRLAISQSLTESAGLDRSFVILDEVFGSQDVERRDLIIDALTGLKQRFPQIILITHVEELKQRVEQLIEVEPTGRGYSEVRVNGELV
ncbi:MAG TPA: SMC family ATPase [candidate division Zixibacteria bacterium]|nr:SMC family ATPase [candidate division Zixibacteria bacterium]